MVGEGFIIVVGAMWLFLAIYVATEAKKENRSTGFWFLFTLIFGIFALLLWVGRANKSYKKIDDTTESRGNSFQISSFETNLLRVLLVVVSLLIGILGIFTGILAGPDSGKIMMGVVFLILGLAFEHLIRMLKSKSDQNRTDATPND